MLNNVLDISQEWQRNSEPAIGNVCRPAWANSGMSVQVVSMILLNGRGQPVISTNVMHWNTHDRWKMSDVQVKDTKIMNKGTCRYQKIHITFTIINYANWLETEKCTESKIPFDFHSHFVANMHINIILPFLALLFNAHTCKIDFPTILAIYAFIYFCKLTLAFHASWCFCWFR